MAIAVEDGTLHWNDRIIDLDPGFQLKHPWVTREVRAFDIIAQRLGLPAYVNDGISLAGFEEETLVRSLRDVARASSFRSTFAYTNITHMLAGRIIAKLAHETSWGAVLDRELLGPLGMRESSWTAAADGDAPSLTFAETGAQWPLEPWDGAIYLIRPRPTGRVTALVAGYGDNPLGFAQFVLGSDAKLTDLRFTIQEQTYEFHRQ
jgi:CubicO group peptidase (beta-lactamase class C family)